MSRPSSVYRSVTLPGFRIHGKCLVNNLVMGRVCTLDEKDVTHAIGSLFASYQPVGSIPKQLSVIQSHVDFVISSLTLPTKFYTGSVGDYTRVMGMKCICLQTLKTTASVCLD